MFSPTHSPVIRDIFLNIEPLLKLARISNWVKNVVIFIPIIFGEHLTNAENLINCVYGFIAFSFLASSIYVINDIADVESDKIHPKKKYRPIASGAISIPRAYAFFIFLLTLSILIAYIFLGAYSWIYLIAYFILNLLYTFKLKKIGLLDIFIIALFFEIRLYLGGELSMIVVSHWLSMLTFFLAAFIAFSKRYDDFLISDDIHQNIRESLVNYNLDFLKAIILLLATVILIIYVLYTLSETGGEKYCNNFYQTIFFVFLGVCRYLQIIFVEKGSGNPVKILYSDKTIQGTCIGWLIIVLYFIYL